MSDIKKPLTKNLDEPPREIIMLMMEVQKKVLQGEKFSYNEMQKFYKNFYKVMF